MLEAATRYIQRGWRVFPLKPGDKVPMGPWKSYSGDYVMAGAHWGPSGARCPNMGIWTGPSGLIVVDIDMGTRTTMKDGREVEVQKVGYETWAALEREHGHVDTYCVKTASGGFHLYYAAPAGWSVNGSASKLGDDVDTRSGDSYVVAPPSVNSRGRWTPVSGDEIAPCPTWILEALTKSDRAAVRDQSRTPAGPMAGEREVLAHVAEHLARLRNAPERVGNDTASSVSYMIGQFVGAGQLDIDQAEDACLEAIAGWTFRDAESERGMVNTIRRQLRFGAHFPRAWEQSMSALPEPELITIPTPATVAEAETETESDEFEHVPYPVFGDALTELASPECRGTLNQDCVILSAIMVAAACLPKVSVPSSGKIHRPTLWGATIGVSGSGKTPASDYVLEPLRKLDAEEKRRFMAQKAAISRAEMAQKEVRRANKLGSDAHNERLEDGKPALDIHDAGEMAISGDPVNKSIIMKDATYEKMCIRVVDGSSGTAFNLVNELPALMKRWDKFSRDSSVARDMMGHWDGEAIDTDRMSRDLVFFENPHILLFGSVQPKYIKDLGESESGMRSRLLGARIHASPTRIVEYSVSEKWNSKVRALYAAKEHAREWIASDGARDMIIARAEEWKAEKGRSNEDFGSHLSKGLSQTWRLAIVVAELMDDSVGRHGGVIEPEHAEIAIRCYEASLAAWKPYARPEALDRREQLINDTMARIEDAVEKLIVCREDGRPFATIAEVARVCPAGLRTRAKVEKAIIEYWATFPARVWVAWVPGMRLKPGVIAIFRNQPSLGDKNTYGLATPEVDIVNNKFKGA